MADHPTAHEAHDLLLVAALVDRDLSEPEAEAARGQVRACAQCAALDAELSALAQAVHELPAIPRPRDFTLQPEDVQRLRPNLLRRMLASFGTARDGVSRPLAVGLTTLGLAGILVGAAPAVSIGQGAGAAQDTTLSMEAPAASGSALTQLAGEEAPAEGVTEAEPDAGTRSTTSSGVLPAAANAPILLGGAVLLAAGLGLGAGRLVVRRRRGNHLGNRFV